MDDAPGNGEQAGNERVVIRAPRASGGAEPAPQSSSRRARRPRSIGSTSEADLPMAVAVMGGVLLCFAPLLPWWSQHIGVIELEAHITGVTTWPGILCELSGAVLLSMCAYMISRPEVRLNVSVLAAGLVALAVSSLAVFAGESLLGAMVELTPQVGLYLTMVGATAGTVGGYMLMRKAPR